MFRNVDDNPRKFELVSLIDVIFLLLIFFLVVTSVSPLTKRAQKKIIISTQSLSEYRPNARTVYDAIFVVCSNGVKIICRRNYTIVYHGGHVQANKLQAVSIHTALNYIRHCIGGNRFLIRTRANIPWGQILELYNGLLQQNLKGRVDFELVGTHSGNFSPPINTVQIVYGQ